MLRLKLIDIKNTNMRNDYNQVLAVTSDGFDELKSCMHSIYSEQEKNMIEISNKLIEERKISWLLQTIEQKLEDVIDMFIDITHKLEFLQIQLWKKVTSNIETGNVSDTFEYVKRINKIAFPPRVDYDDIMHITKLFHFELMINQLKRNLYGASKFWEIKDNAKRNELENMFKEFTQTQIKNQLTAMYKKSMLDKMMNEYNKSKAHNKMKGVYDSFLLEAVVQDPNCRDQPKVIEKVAFYNCKSKIIEQDCQEESQHSLEFNQTVETQHDLLQKDKPRSSKYLMDAQIKSQSIETQNFRENIIITDQSMFRPKHFKLNQQFSFIDPQSDKHKSININQMQIQQKGVVSQSMNQIARETIDNNQERNSQSIPVIHMNDLGNIESSNQKIIIDQNILGQINNEYQSLNDQMERAQTSMQKHENVPVAQKQSTNHANQAIESMEDVYIQFQTQSNEENQDNQIIKLEEFLDGRVNLSGLEFTQLKQKAMISTPKNNLVIKLTNQMVNVDPTSQNFIISQRQKEQSSIEPNIYNNLNNIEDQKQKESFQTKNSVKLPKKLSNKGLIIVVNEQSEHLGKLNEDGQLQDGQNSAKDTNKDQNQ